MTIFYTENLTRKVDLRYISTSKISLKNATKLFKSGFWHVERIFYMDVRKLDRYLTQVFLHRVENQK